MGTWGPGLYDDDVAADLRDEIALVAKVPRSGDELLDFLGDMFARDDANDVNGQAFWLVVADQFERRGIGCPKASLTALSIIEDHRNLDALRELGADKEMLAKRSSLLQALAARLRAPRPLRARAGPKQPPAHLLGVGEILSFPTMDGFAKRPNERSFSPNGWGALVVLEIGRAFDWIPWCAVASLTVDPTRKSQAKDVIGTNLIFHPQTNGAARCLPKRSDIRNMELELIDRVALDSSRVKQVISRWSVSKSISCGWPISYAGYSRGALGPPVGAPLAGLVANAR